MATTKKYYKNKKSAKEIVEETQKEMVKKIIARMKEGGLNWKQDWTPEMVSPRNPTSNVYYLGRNTIRLFEEAINKQRKDPRWVTFKQAEKEGWKIKKGAKSIVLAKWVFQKQTDEEKEKEEQLKKEGWITFQKPKVIGVNYFRVFNAEDVEGIPPFKLKPLTKTETLEIAEYCINSSKVPVIEAAQGRAYYSPSQNIIALPLRETFKSQEAFLATALHEMIHSTAKELDRKGGKVFGDKDYAKEELVAELGSLFLQGRLGIKLEEEHIENHSAYLDSWIKSLENNPKELSIASKEAAKASELLYSRFKEYVLENNLNHLLQEEIFSKPKEESISKENLDENLKNNKNSLRFAGSTIQEEVKEVGGIDKWISKTEKELNNAKTKENPFAKKLEIEKGKSLGR